MSVLRNRRETIDPAAEMLESFRQYSDGLGDQLPFRDKMGSLLNKGALRDMMRNVYAQEYDGDDDNVLRVREMCGCPPTEANIRANASSFVKVYYEFLREVEGVAILQLTSITMKDSLFRIYEATFFSIYLSTSNR